MKTEQKDQREIAKFDADLTRLKHDFALLPPEINSMLIHAGPGPGPLLAAATAWDGLAQELQDAATSYESLTSGLKGGSEFGPASSPAAAAAAPYMAWMHTTAQEAERAAAQARAAAAAFEESVKEDAANVRG